MKRIGPLVWMRGHDIGWFRIFGVGVHWNARPPLFSERNGHRKFVRVGRWRIRFLRSPYA